MVRVCLFLLLGWFTLLMINLTVPYLSFDDQTAFLRIKQWVIHNSIWKTAFYVHVITSCFCLIAGFTQFSKGIRMNQPGLHRFIGKLYIVIILFLSGPAGIIMAYYANGGLLSQFAFLFLAILWIVFSYQGYRHARKLNFSEHRKFLIRSFALTLSAITLRTWKWILVLIFRPHPMDAYMLVAWLGWVPNLLIAEWYLRTGCVKKRFQPVDNTVIASSEHV